MKTWKIVTLNWLSTHILYWTSSAIHFAICLIWLASIKWQIGLTAFDVNRKWEAFHKPIYFAILTLLSATNQLIMHLFLPWWLWLNRNRPSTAFDVICWLFNCFPCILKLGDKICCSGCVCVRFFISMFGISIALFHSHFNELCQYKCSPPPALPLSFCHSLSLSLSLPVFTIPSLSLLSLSLSASCRALTHIM